MKKLEDSRGGKMVSIAEDTKSAFLRRGELNLRFRGKRHQSSLGAMQAVQRKELAAPTILLHLTALEVRFASHRRENRCLCPQHVNPQIPCRV